MSLSFQSLRNILGFKKPLLNDNIVLTNNISDLLLDVIRNQVVTIICVYLQSPLLTSADNEAELLLCSINYGLIKTCKGPGHLLTFSRPLFILYLYLKFDLCFSWNKRPMSLSILLETLCTLNPRLPFEPVSNWQDLLLMIELDFFLNCSWR